MGLLSLAIFSATVCLACLLFAPRSAAIEGEPAVSVKIQGDTVILTVTLPKGDAVCGFSAEIFYNSESLRFVGVHPTGDADGGGHIACVNEGGRLRVIADGYKASFYDRILAVTFSVEGALGEDSISLISLELYRWRSGEFFSERIDFDPSRLDFEIYQDEKAELVRLDGAIYQGGGAYARLSVEGCAYAAGLEITLVDLLSGEMTVFSVVRGMPLSASESEISVVLPSGGRFCVILRPVAFYGEGVASCSGKTFVLIEGTLLGDITDF